VFSRVQAEGFRSLRSVDQRMGPFQALVGPNASGKTTFLDVIDLFCYLHAVVQVWSPQGCLGQRSG